jgi:uncharacterized membrane protein YwaF
MDDPFWEFAKKTVGRLIYTAVMSFSIFCASIFISFFVTYITGNYELGASAFWISFVVLFILAVIDYIFRELESGRGDKR